MKIATALLTSALFTTAVSAEAINTPTPTVGVQAFLDVLNSGNGKPMELMTPNEARQVLIGAQKAKLPPAQVSEKTIQINGQSIQLKLLNQKMLKAFFLYLCSSMVAVGC